MAELAMGILRLHRGGQTWLLRYAACGDTQEFPHDEVLASREQAERYVWRHYASCLTCQLDQRLKEYQLRPSRTKAVAELVARYSLARGATVNPRHRTQQPG
jgi:hypothetical protein